MVDYFAKDEDWLKADNIEHIISKEQIQQRMLVLTNENLKLKEMNKGIK